MTAKDYIKEKWASKIESHGRLVWQAEILTIILIPSGVGAKGGDAGRCAAVAREILIGKRDVGIDWPV